MPSRWRRGVQFLVTLGLLAGMLACGGSGGSASGDSDPTGRVIPGTGPVTDSADAAARLLAQYLGLGDTRQAGPVIGTGDDPTVGVFAVQPDPLPRGTTIRPYFDAAAYVLNRPYYVFFVDPNLLANFEHLAYYLYVRPTDGAIFESVVHSWPVVNGASRLVSEADRLANAVYYHEDFAMMLNPPAGRQAPVLSGASTGALIVASEEARRQGDIDNAAEYLQNLTGEANPLSVLWEKHPDQFDKDDFARQLRESSAGLGANDKYFLFLATHGSAPPNSQVQIGSDNVGYEELCRLINENVSAGHINIFNAACFGGNMDAVFAQWDAQTDKAVHWFTDTDASHPSYSAPDTIGLKCALMQMQEALDAARSDGVVTLAEIEQAMQDLELTADEILEKICDAAGIDPDDPNPPAWKEDIEQDDPGDDPWPRPGEPGTGGFDPAPPTPLEVPQFVLDLLEQLRRARLDDDPVQLGPLYHPDYLYNGRNHNQITRPAQGQDVTALQFTQIQVQGLGGDDIFNVDFRSTTQVPGTLPIVSDQEGSRQFRIEGGPAAPLITSDRLVLWTQFDRGGALGLQAQPPGAPVIQPPVVVGGTPFQVDSFFDVFYDISLSGLGGDDALHVETTASFLRNNRQLAGTQVDSVFATLGSNTVQLQRQGSTDTYVGDVPIPRQLGRWVLSISASSRIANGQTSDFVSSAVGRSIEVRIVP